jgi:hypothetical protein
VGELTPEKFDVGLRDKLMGQVNVVLAAQDALVDGGSFTLTSGILSEDPIRLGVCASLVNGALESFVRAAAIELPRGLRINIVSPTLLQESVPAYGPYFPGYKPVPAAGRSSGIPQERRGPANRPNLQGVVKSKVAYFFESPAAFRLFVTEKTFGTPLARKLAKFLSDSESTTPSRVTWPFSR